MAKITNQVNREELKKKIEAIDAPEEKVEPEAPVEEAEEPIEEPEADEPPAAPKTVEKETDENAETEERDETDWKARYAGSTREAQVLATKNRQITDAIDSAGKLEITEAELKELYTEWDLLDDVQRRLARESALSSKRFQLIQEKVESVKKIDEWVGKVRDFSQDPVTLSKYPQLQGHETEFSQFCMVPSRIDRDMEDSLRGFLYTLKPTKPQRKTLFQAGGGGEAPQSKSLSVGEIKFIRENQPKEYTRLLKAGKIKIEV